MTEARVVRDCALALQATPPRLGTEPLNEAPAQTMQDRQPTRPWQTARVLKHQLRQARLTTNQHKPCAGRRRTDSPHQQPQLSATELIARAERRRTRGQLTVTVRDLKPQRRNEKLGSVAVRSSAAFEAPNY